MFERLTVDDWFILYFCIIFYLISLYGMWWYMKNQMKKYLRIAAEALHELRCEQCRKEADKSDKESD